MSKAKQESSTGKSKLSSGSAYLLTTEVGGGIFLRTFGSLFGQHGLTAQKTLLFTALK
jgi:hypothetical protein